jgi:hypothetical protein
VVNNINAPNHKAAKKLNTILTNCLHLDFLYNTINSESLATEVTSLKNNNNHRQLTLDIKYLYVNIPICETIHFTKAQLLKYNKKTSCQIIDLLDIILNQNYLSFQEQIYKPNKGVAMGSPISGTITEVFLQTLEKHVIKQLMDNRTFTFYTRHVDDIFLIFDTTKKNPDDFLQHINNIHNNIQLNPTHESDNKNNFLDLTITRETNHHSINIYRKPTTTDTTIHFLSNHPPERKLSAYRFYIRRMLSLPLNQKHINNEWLHIHVAQNKGIPLNLMLRLRRKIQHNTLPNPNSPKPPTPTLFPRNNGQPSTTPHHRSGKLTTSLNTPTLIFPSKATTPWLNS